MSVNFTELFKHDTQILKALEAVKNAGTTLDSTRNTLIARTIVYAYEQKDAQIINSAVDFYESEGVKGLAKPFAHAVTVVLKGMFKEMQAGRRTVYIPNAWADHDKVCRILKEHNVVKEYREAAAKEREAARADKPAELVRSYSPECHNATTADRIDAALARLGKASAKDHEALNSAVIDGKDKALAYLTDEASAIKDLRELCTTIANHKLTFAEVTRKIKELN